MDKPNFLNALLAARQEYEAALAAAGTGAAIRDLVAHVTWYEREMVGLIGLRRLEGSVWWDLPTDRRNALIQEANSARTLDDVRGEARQAWAELRPLLEAMDDQALNDPACYEQMPDDWVPWQIIAGNTTDHYLDHAAELRG